jgi:hypothetical protein
MKTKLLFILLLFSAIVANSQTRQPFSNIGKKVKVVTLTNGKYDEFFDENPLQRVGSSVINIKTKKITKVELSQGEIDELENAQASRFLSVDPLMKSYPMLTPYQYASNTPIQAIDLDGLEKYVVTYWYTNKKGEGKVQIDRVLNSKGEQQNMEIVFNDGTKNDQSSVALVLQNAVSIQGKKEDVINRNYLATDEAMLIRKGITSVKNGPIREEITNKDNQLVASGKEYDSDYKLVTSRGYFSGIKTSAWDVSDAVEIINNQVKSLLAGNPNADNNGMIITLASNKLNKGQLENVKKQLANKYNSAEIQILTPENFKANPNAKKTMAFSSSVTTTEKKETPKSSSNGKD